MATIDEELAQLEKDIRQLKIEYDQFFGGGRKRRPQEIEWGIEMLGRGNSERGAEMKSGSVFVLAISPRHTQNIRIFSASAWRSAERLRYNVIKGRGRKLLNQPARK